MLTQLIEAIAKAVADHASALEVLIEQLGRFLLAALDSVEKTFCAVLLLITLTFCIVIVLAAVAAFL